MAIIKPNNNTISAITALPAGVGGKVLQVVQATFGTQVAIASTSYTDTGITATITPSSSSNKILVMVSLQSTYYHDNNGQLYSNARIVRGSTGVFESEQFVGSWVGVGGNGYQQLYNTVPLNYLDSPSTTDATTYKVTVKNHTTAGNRQIKINSASTGKSSITLMEVSA